MSSAASRASFSGRTHSSKPEAGGREHHQGWQRECEVTSSEARSFASPTSEEIGERTSLELFITPKGGPRCRDLPAVPHARVIAILGDVRPSKSTVHMYRVLAPRSKAHTSLRSDQLLSLGDASDQKSHSYYGDYLRSWQFPQPDSHRSSSASAWKLNSPSCLIGASAACACAT